MTWTCTVYTSTLLFYYNFFLIFMRVYVSITMTASYFRIVQLARLETKGRSFKRGSFSTQFIFFLRLRRLFFLFPFPIVFGSRNFFFLSFLVSAFLDLNMPETCLNLFFLMMLISRLKADWQWIDTAYYFDCFFFFPISFSFFFFVSVLFFFLFSFWWWWSRFWSGCISSLLFSSLWVTWRPAQWCHIHYPSFHHHRCWSRFVLW